MKEIAEIWTSTWTSSRSSTRECENKDVFDNLPQDKQDPINNDIGKIIRKNMQDQIIINNKVVEKYKQIENIVNNMVKEKYNLKRPGGQLHLRALRSPAGRNARSTRSRTCRTDPGARTAWLGGPMNILIMRVNLATSMRASPWWQWTIATWGLRARRVCPPRL